MKERIGYVDAAKGLGMLLIMLGHITKYDNPVDLWMSSFKVVIFYIMSGFLMSYTGSVKKRSFGVFMKKTLTSLAIPYVTFSILGIMFKVGCIYVKEKPIKKITKVFWEYLWDSVVFADYFFRRDYIFLFNKKPHCNKAFVFSCRSVCDNSNKQYY